MPILVKSNTESILDVSQLITYPSEHELLHIDHISLFKCPNVSRWSQVQEGGGWRGAWKGN